MDGENPTLREWCLMIIRNSCQVSEGIRGVLEGLKKAENPGDMTLDRLGIKDEYEK